MADWTPRVQRLFDKRCSQDMLYRALCLRDDDWSTLKARCEALRQKHPDVVTLQEHACSAELQDNADVMRAMYLVLLLRDDELRDDLLKSTKHPKSASQFMLDVLPGLVDRALRGYMSLTEFVNECRIQYVCT